MDKKEQILHYYRVDGLSLREISRRVGLNQKTAYSSCRKSKRTRLTDAVCSKIDYWLEENARRRLKRLHKQCLKRQDIHRVLIEFMTT